MRTAAAARGALLALLLSLLGEGALGTCSRFEGREGGGRSHQLVCNQQPHSSATTATSTTSPLASFVGAGSNMLGRHAWRTAAARRVLTRPSFGLSRLQTVGSGAPKRGSSTSTVAARELRRETSSSGNNASDEIAATGTGDGTAATRGGKKGSGPRQARKAATGVTAARRAGKGAVVDESYAYAETLSYLSSPPEDALKGVGPRKAEQLAKLGVTTVADLLWHLPTGMVDRRETSHVADLVEGEVATMLLKVVKVQSDPRKRSPRITRVHCVDVAEDKIDIVMFGGSWLCKNYEPGETKVVSGKVTMDKYSGALVMNSPEVVAPAADLEKVLVIQPTYPLTAGLSGSSLRSVIALALDQLEGVTQFPPEWIDQETMREHGWPSLREALSAAHSPQQEEDLRPSGATRSRLAYDELLASQIVLALRRRQTRGIGGGVSGDRGDQGDGSAAAAADEMARAGGAALVEEGRRRLPFDLTSSQNKALDEILKDMDGSGSCSSLRMFRLVQGDVGSGKTAVAFLAMLRAAGQGSQSCMLAPTEVLTVQHLQTLRSMAEGIERPDGKGNLRVELLTGSVKGKSRQQLLNDVKAGEVDILVATHAVLTSASTAFRDLGLAVVDEEQRFGVEQRDKLTGFAQHVLYLSATPIPRSLTLALYGDMEISQIREMPRGAANIETTLVPVAKAKEVMDRLKGREDTDDKVFWVLPQINKSGASTRQHLASATERYDALVKELGEDRVTLLHGKMTSAEKNKRLSEFSGGEKGRGLRVLVSTSIIEVGVDVPRAGVCVVENAEMFGLSQLHQLRGRLGRTDRGKRERSTTAPTGSLQQPTTPEEDPSQDKRQTSHCILLYGPDVGKDATERLKAVRKTRDGFLLAERDLALRGPGEVLGMRQKGYIEGKFKVADLARQGSLAEHASKRARRLVESWTPRRAAADAEDAAASGAPREGGTVTLKEGGADADFDEERGRPESLGLLLVLCGLGADAEALLSGFASRTPPPGATDGDAAGGEAGGEADRGGAAIEREAKEHAPERATEFPQSFPVPAASPDGVESLITSTPAADPPMAASSSALDFVVRAEATAAVGGVSDSRTTTGPGSRSKEPGPELAVPAAVYFDDEADFLEKSASEYAEMMEDQDEEDEYLSGFSFAPPPRSPPPPPPPTRLQPAGRQQQHERRSSGRVAPTGTPVGGGGGAPSGEGVAIIRRADLSEGTHTVVVVDVETTGLRAKQDRIIQLAAKVVGSENPRHSFAEYIDPGEVEVPPKVREITGITPEILAANGARPFPQVWPEFAAWLSGVVAEEQAEGRGEGGVVFVAHNAQFDHKFLTEELSRCGFSRFMMGQDMGVVCIIDSLRCLKENSLWRQKASDFHMPTRPENFKLGGMFEHLYGYEMPDAHNAMGDVVGLERILSAPGINEGWRGVASSHPTCQIPVPRSLAELQAATNIAARTRKPPAKTTKADGWRYYSNRRTGR